MSGALENLFAFHCAPTFMGIKPSNLISIPNRETAGLDFELTRYNRLLNSRGVFFNKIFSCEKRTLVLVYRQDLIEKQLQQMACQKFLETYGYNNMCMEEMLVRLGKRIAYDGCFPHEIGLFLGYPLEDVLGFIENNGQNYLTCGYWKVYGNLEKAKTLFSQYSCCRHDFCCKVDDGFSIEQLCIS